MELHNSAYLEPVDDGLAMRPSGNWATEKLDYLKRYVDIFETSMREHWPRRHFIDLFSGPGKCRSDSGKVFLGSPLIALTTKFPFSGYFFVDIEPENITTLHKRCSASPLENLITFVNEDSNVAVRTVIDQIQSSDRTLKTSSLNLAFLDPAGLELHWATVEALAKVQRMDLIIHYPVMGLKRTLEAASKTDEHKIDLFFGDRAWRDFYAKTRDPSVVERELLGFYRKKLESLGYVEVKQDGQAETDPAIRNTKQGLLYRLLFASKHPLGDKFWKQVIQRDVHGQRRLF